MKTLTVLLACTLLSGCLANIRSAQKVHAIYEKANTPARKTPYMDRFEELWCTREGYLTTCNYRQYKPMKGEW